MEELITGYLGHGVMGLVAGTMLVLYIRKDRECSRLHALMFGKIGFVFSPVQSKQI